MENPSVTTHQGGPGQSQAAAAPVIHYVPIGDGRYEERTYQPPHVEPLELVQIVTAPNWGYHSRHNGLGDPWHAFSWSLVQSRKLTGVMRCKARETDCVVVIDGVIVGEAGTPWTRPGHYFIVGPTFDETSTVTSPIDPEDERAATVADAVAYYQKLTTPPAGGQAPGDRVSVYLAVNNTDDGGTAIVIEFPTMEALEDWQERLEKVTDNSEEPFGYRAEWGTATRILSPDQAMELIGYKGTLLGEDDQTSKPQIPQSDAMTAVKVSAPVTDATALYPARDTYEWQEWPVIAIEMGGYGDLTAIDPVTGRRLWMGDAFPKGATAYDAMRRLVDAMEQHHFLDGAADPTRKVTA